MRGAFESAIKEMERVCEESGTSQHKAGDYCLLVVQSILGSGSQVVIGKFKQAGNPKCHIRLN